MKIIRVHCLLCCNENKVITIVAINQQNLHTVHLFHKQDYVMGNHLYSVQCSHNGTIASIYRFLEKPLYDFLTTGHTSESEISTGLEYFSCMPHQGCF